MALFRHAVEARAIDNFWQSRKDGRLLERPEKMGAGLLAVFAQGVLSQAGHGFVLREILSGIGFVDVGIAFANVFHLIELKVITRALIGPSQLQTYMRTERRREGWLVLFDARPPYRKDAVPPQIPTPDGIIRIVVVDINPLPPSRK